MPDSFPPEHSRSSAPKRRSRVTRASRSGVRRLADVRDGEGLYVAGAALTLGGIVGAHLCLETARDALFLSTLPPQGLAFVYLAMAALGFFVGRYDRTVARALGRTSALILALMGSAVGTLLFYMGPRSDAMTFALYLWTGVVGTILTVQFWLFTGSRMSPAQARRLYGLIGAGGVIGAVCGGLAAQVVTHFFPVDSLLVLAAAVQLGTALLLTWAPSPATVAEERKPIRTAEAMQVMQRSAYLKRVATLTVVATATLLVTDYQFKSITAAAVPAERLGSFLATYYTGLNVLALVVQVFLAMRVLQRAGTIVALTLLPLTLALSGGAMLAVGTGLTAVLLAKGADGALRHSLHRVSNELLFLPLTPAERSSAKPVFDSVLTRGAQGLTALALLGLATLGQDSPKVIAGVLVALALLWILAALRLRGPYLEQFRRNLGKNQEDAGFELDQLTLDGVEVVVEALSSPEESRVLGAMAVFSGARRTGLIPALVLYHPSPRVLVRALNLIPSHDRSDWVPLAERLMNHESEEVRLQAVKALGRYGHLDKLDPETFSSMRVMATALFFQANHLARPETHLQVSALCHQDGDVGAQQALLQAISEFGNDSWSDTLMLLEALHRPELDRALPPAMARARDIRFIPLLQRRLAVREGRHEVSRALVAMGDVALQALSTALSARETPDAVRVNIPTAIGRFGNRKAAHVLLDTLQSQLPGAVRYKALRGLSRLAARRRMRLPRAPILAVLKLNAREGLRVALAADVIDASLEDAPRHARPAGELLVTLLHNKHDQSLERITRLLQLLHPNEDLRRVYYALQGGRRTAKVAAAELLEVLTLGYDEDLRELLRALSDAAPTRERTANLLALLGQNVSDEVSTLRDLVTDPDPPLSALAAEYARRSEVLEVAVEVEQALLSNPWLAETAGASLVSERSKTSPSSDGTTGS